MNPQNNPTNQPPGLSLPPVDTSQKPVAPPVAPTPSTQAQPQAPLPAVKPSDPKDVIVPTPEIADDNDLIEKEWVEKAKQLIDQTKEDPFKQNKEINKFKAVYIKKRYNKDIQLSKD